MAILPCLYLRLGEVQIRPALSGVLRRAGLAIFGDGVNEPVLQCGLRVHPRRGAHHGSNLLAALSAPALIHVQDALLARLQQPDGIHELPLVAPGYDAGVVDHPETARRHLQPVRRHGQYRRRGSRRAGNSDPNAAGVGAHVVEHTHGGVAAATVGIQPDMHVVRKLVFCSVQRFVKGLRGDLVPEPHFVVDIAV